MKLEPLACISTPACNAERHIGDAVRSALDQTWRKWGLLIVDAGSTDETWALLEALTDPRMRLFHPEDRGVSAARNAALDAGYRVLLNRVAQIFSISKIQIEVLRAQVVKTGFLCGLSDHKFRRATLPAGG